MSNVIPFRPMETIRELVGPAKCRGCNHVFDAEAPVGTTTLTCPQCGGEKAQWVYSVGASDPDDVLFRCRHCGSEALTAFLRNGRFFLMCMGCGVDHTQAVFG